MAHKILLFNCFTGKTGQPIKLSANYFKLVQMPDWNLYQYRVDFAPQEDRTNVKKALFRRAVAKILPAYMFDGTVLYCTNRLETTELFVEDTGKNNIKFPI